MRPHAEKTDAALFDLAGYSSAFLGNPSDPQVRQRLMAQAKARHPEWKDRFFNVGFIIDPSGAVILQHYKTMPLFPVEHSMCPHDVYDWWIDRYGNTLDAFWPVADTAIGDVRGGEGFYHYRQHDALEIAHRGVTVNAVAPGYIATPMTAVNRYPMPFMLAADEAARRFARAIERGLMTAERASRASDREIKSAYRKLSLLHHPDKGGSADKFQSIAKAYPLKIALSLGSDESFESALPARLMASISTPIVS